MDITINLVESYLRLTGYFTLSEFEVARRGASGRFETITDVDIMAIRTPGEAHASDGSECEVLLIDDPVLMLEPDCVDVILGEVKQGHAELNPGIRDHGVLHSMLRRIEWLYADGLDDSVAGLQESAVVYAAARGGGQIRTRLVAFGRSTTTDLHTVSISHIVATLLSFFERHAEAFKPVQFRDPAPAFLRLLVKAGFDISQ